MKQLLTVLVAAMFAASSFAALAQDKGMNKKPSASAKKSGGKNAGAMSKKSGTKKAPQKSATK